MIIYKQIHQFKITNYKEKLNMNNAIYEKVKSILVESLSLEEGDIIVTTPRLVREGENIKF